MVKEIIYGRLNLSRGTLRRMKQGGGVFSSTVSGILLPGVSSR